MLRRVGSTQAVPREMQRLVLLWELPWSVSHGISSGSSPCNDATSEEASSPTAQPSPPSAGGFRTLDGVPLPRYVPQQRRERAAAVPLQDAIRQVKAAARAKFDETVEVALNLGIDPRRGDQMVRGVATLPHGTGRSVRVCVFATDEAAASARAAGAEVVGGADLIAQIQGSGGSGLAFDKCVATPDMMPALSKIARILGPRGLMPNPKLGSVTQDVAAAVAQVKQGRVEFRADKGGVLHAGIGKASFSDDALAANTAALAAAVLAARPKGVKGSGAGGYMLKTTLSSTMGAGVPVTVGSMVAAAQAARGRVAQ